MIRAVALCLLLWPAMTWAQDDIAGSARAAADRLEAAARALTSADDARDRVKALTETVQAFEEGLESMRDGLRRATLQEARLSRQLAASHTEIGQLLSTLQTIGHAPTPILLMHPSGPTGTARAGMIVADVTPALAARAEALRAQLQEVTTLRQLQQDATDTLQNGLQGVQEARAELSKAIADRTPLPKRFTEDPVRTAILIASTETLEGFASGLSQITTNEVDAPLAAIDSLKGELPLPVTGRILRRFGEADAAGISRPGLVVATRPRALVSAPTAATIRYRGPLLDYGNVMILEPQPGTVFVFAGLDVVYGDTGDVIPANSPIGLMAGDDAGIGAIVPQKREDTGTERTETLYIEVRQDSVSVDPETWFITLKDN